MCVCRTSCGSATCPGYHGSSVVDLACFDGGGSMSMIFASISRKASTHSDVVQSLSYPDLFNDIAEHLV